MKNIDTKTPFSVIAESRQGGRSENQDTCAWQDTPFGLLILVCDGMGGGPSGKYASQLAADSIVNYVLQQPKEKDRKEMVKDAISYAAGVLTEAQDNDERLRGMGTTVAALLINRDSAIVAHVGDSRVYLLRGEKKIFRTFDHSHVFELVKAKVLTEEEARLSGESNIITQALGPMEKVSPDVRELPYEKGDRFMLCSDGIWGAMPEKELLRIAGGTKSLSGAVESLAIKVDEIGRNNGGHHDNLTVAILQTPFDSKLKLKMSRKMRYAFIALCVIACVSVIFNFIQLRHAYVLKRNNVRIEKTDNPMTRAEIEQILKEERREMQSQIDYYNSKLKEIEKNMSEKTPAANDEQTQGIIDEVEIINEINSIISELQQIETINVKGKALNDALDKAKGNMDNLVQNLASHNINIEGTDFQKCIKDGWINNKVAKNPDHKNHDSHINAIIQSLKSLKQKIQNQNN